MFKPQVLRRGFSLYRSLPRSQVARSATRDGLETIHVQRVRIRKPFFTRSKLFGTILAVGGTYEFLKWVDEEDEEEEEYQRQNGENGWQVAPGDEDEEEEDDDALLFFPTGLSRARPRTLYQASDPEWQEFIKLSQDKARLSRIHNNVEKTILADIANNKWWTAKFGKINFVKVASALKVYYPDGPPIEYERPGIELTDDLTFRRSTRPVEEEHHERLTNLLSPTPVATALYADSAAKVSKLWQDFRTSIGWGYNSEQKQDPLSEHVHVTAVPSRSKTGTATSADKHPASPLAAASTPRVAPQQRDTQTSPPEPPKETLASALADTALGRWLPPVSATALTLDLSTFHMAMKKVARPQSRQVPRGAVIVQGTMAIPTQRAVVMLKIVSIYDPAIEKCTWAKASIASVMERPIVMQKR